MSENRIQQFAPTRTGERQTQKDSFGDLITKGAGTAVGSTAGLLAAITTGNPVASAAVAGVTHVLGMAMAPNASTTTLGGGTSGGATGGTGAAGGGVGGDAMELMQMQQAMQAEGFKLNSVYLGMQREMQRESREFTAVSNIMKVRHDTAKSAINNVR